MKIERALSDNMKNLKVLTNGKEVNMFTILKDTTKFFAKMSV